MLQASRIAIIGLFVLLQLFAPLVHAHAGGGGFSGAIHIPGLEFLARASGNSAQAFTHKACSDVIVGLASGFRNQGGATNAPPDSDFDLPHKLIFAAGLPSDSKSRFPIFESTTPRTVWLTPAPRAPPTLA